MLELEFGQSDAAEVAERHGCIATWGKGATVPSDWKDAGCVHPDLAGVMMVCVSCLFACLWPLSLVRRGIADDDGIGKPDTTEEPGPANYTVGYLQYNVRLSPLTSSLVI